jgi:hypothetical protein
MKTIQETIQEVYAAYASGKPIGEIEKQFPLIFDSDTRNHLLASILQGVKA